jgi:hypothetical protein
MKGHRRISVHDIGFLTCRSVIKDARYFVNGEKGDLCIIIIHTRGVYMQADIAIGAHPSHCE